jgi:hypothetical protein
MKIFGYEIKKRQKERLVQIKRSNRQIDLIGDGWTLLDQVETGFEISKNLQQSSGKTNLGRKGSGL